jgi:hypothetical protein
MAAANPLWGAPRIHGELRIRGVEVSERTVSCLPKRQPHSPSQSWKTFLKNHIASAASMDFFTVPTLTGLGLFVLVSLSYQRWRTAHVNVTDDPTTSSAAQQLAEPFSYDTAPTWLHRDRDGISGDGFKRRLAGMEHH